jgi:V8-like Glu-specific endopeptidase
MILTAAVGASLLLVVLLSPAIPGAARLAVRLAAAVRTLGGDAHDATVMPRGAVPPGTSPAVGALFRITGRGGRPELTSHFCTASVVDSPSGDLVLTAAHCVSGLVAGQFAFVPGYRDGAAPYGVWTVTRVFVDRAWSARASPDDDVAFLVVRRPGTTASVQSATGGERLGIGQPAGQVVQVTGYPETAGAPITCLNQAGSFSGAELQFDCDGFTDGTSGSALLADVSPVTGLGTAIGVIGGYQQGGFTASVSYADRLGSNVGALYKAATGVRSGAPPAKAPRP